MNDLDYDEEDDAINEDMKNFNELGLIRDSEVLYQNQNQTSLSDKGKPINIHNNNKNPKFFNQTLNIPNKIKENLINDSTEEINEDNDADQEDFKNRNKTELNNTLDDVWTMHIYGRNDPGNEYIPLKRNAKFFERILHPIQFGSLRGSIFGLTSMCLGAGSMVLAKKCQELGLVNFIILLILGGFLSYCCLVMMIKAGKSIKEKNYSKVVKAILGNKIGILVDITIAIFLFGVLISYQVIIYQTIGAVVFDIMKMIGKMDEKYETFKDYKENIWQEKKYLKFPIMFGVAVLDYPLCLLKDISKMRIPSLIGVLAIVYSIIVVIIESFFYIFNENKDIINQMNWIDITKSFNIKDGIPIFGGIATVFFLYSCHAGAFPVYKSLRNNTTRRIKKVFRRSILLDVFLYVFIATSSFITSPLDSPDLILYRPNLKGFDPDYFILIAKIGIIFNLFFSTPANYAGFRISFFQLVFGNNKITNKKNIIVTACVLAIVILIGALYDKILDYITLLGGFCSVVFCILIPGLIYAKNDNIPKSKFKKYFIIVTVVILLIIGFTSGILTILFQMVKIYPDEEEKK